MITLLDCDGVLGDFTGRFAERLMETWGFDLRDEDITTFDHSTVPNWQPRFWDLLKEPGFVAEMKPLPGARAAVETLRGLGEVLCVTSPFDGAPHWMNERVEWLKHHMGFNHKDVIHTHRKDLIRGDILVDDRYEHAWDFPGKGLLFDRPWNQGETKWRVFSWDDVLQIATAGSRLATRYVARYTES